LPARFFWGLEGALPPNQLLLNYFNIFFSLNYFLPAPKLWQASPCFVD